MLFSSPFFEKKKKRKKNHSYCGVVQGFFSCVLVLVLVLFLLSKALCSHSLAWYPTTLLLVVWFFFIFSRLNHTILFGIFPPLQLLPPITLFYDQRGNKGKAVMLIGFPMQSLWEWSFYKCLELDLFRRPKGPTHIFKVAFKF